MKRIFPRDWILLIASLTLLAVFLSDSIFASPNPVLQPRGPDTASRSATLLASQPFNALEAQLDRYLRKNQSFGGSHHKPQL